MARKDIKGKRILFFGLETMGYERRILEKMRELGAIVDYYSERPVSNQMGKAVIKVKPSLLAKKAEDYYRRIMKCNSGTHYDIIFMIKCDVPTVSVLKELKTAFPDAELRLHVWDSLSNIPDIEKKIGCFDRVTSFDRMDCLQHPEFGFRPLFYLDQFADQKPEKEILYDISFCGTIHSDRYRILESIRKMYEKQNLRFYGYYYVQSRFAYYYLKLTDKRFRDVDIRKVHFKTIGSSEVSRIFNASRTIVDIQHPSQTGLTMRTIETLGARKKLITTNADIVNYDFYNENNIFVFDRDNPKLSEEFFASPYEELPDEIYKKYSLREWVLDVLTM